MTGDVLSGGVVFALAAALWLAYLMPTWLRRREYMATERNAVRLQQTLRILAETAEVPQEVRVEATARDVAAQQRILRREEKQAREQLQAAAVAVSTTVTEPPRIRLAPDAARDRARRLRRVRGATSLIMLTGLAIAVFGAFDVIATGSWLVLAGGLVLGVSAVLVLARLAKAGKMRRTAASAMHATDAGELFDHAEHEEPAEQAPAVQVTWTPEPLPKPLYLSRGSIAASAMASVDAATALRRAAAREDLERRAAELAPRLEPQVAQLKPTPSRFARMGVVEAAVESDELDLDAVLRLRRAAG